jgi:hypothetical protein
MTAVQRCARSLVQPYLGWNAALYEPGRELSVRIGFEQ